MPYMIFIQETKCSIQKIKQIHNKWLNKFEFLEVKAENTVGGILTLWNPQKVIIVDAEATRNYLSAIIQPMGMSETFLVTSVYGPQRIDEKLRFLNSLEDLRRRHEEIPWVIGGDFNMIKSLSEKKRGTRILSRDSVGFHSFTEDMDMVDSEMHNGLFTWNNKRGGNAQVASKLDRFLISEKLMLTNTEISSSVLPFGGSDHWPIQLEIKGIDAPRNRPFRFENIWLSHPDFINNIEKWWSEDLQVQGSKMFLLHKRLKHIKIKLKEWNKKDFGNIFVNKKSVEIKLRKLNQAMITDGFDKNKSEQAEKLNLDWENLCKQEEIFWRQKSRIQWLKEDGELQTSHKNIEGVMVQYFRGITNENNLDRDQYIKEITKNIPRMVSREDNFNLNKPVTEPEDILEVVEDSRRSKSILKALNNSFISLIRKQDSTPTPDNFSISVNGSPSEIFTPSRGLRQGDPLSPFLFILMMEGLGRTIKKAKVSGKIKGLHLTENNQALTHQQFVDDTML
eukprot:PITA_23924